ncbi:MAG: DUF1080 domain-containing protein [Planctomycetes bacterium]|nr:DUF1080 domain-containing protein [Planctomycetota bacterium]
MAETPKQKPESSQTPARKVPGGRADAGGNPADTKTAGDSVPMASGNLTRLPAQLGRYQVEKLLGRGNMGAVYLARDRQLDRQVALKVPKLGGSDAKKLLQRLRVEAKAAAQLDHPCICPVYDTGEIDGMSYIALKYIAGETLEERLKKQRLSAPVAIELVLHLAEGLAEAHAKQIYHRDLKPANIKLTPRGLPVIMDFGLAKIAATVHSDASKTQSGTILGSPAYMSPEQAAGRVDEIDHRSDLYALGVILFELLTGQWPFTGGALQVMGQKAILDPPAPLTIDPQLNPRLSEICLKLIARNPADRYPSSAALCDDLRAVRGAMQSGEQVGPTTTIANPNLDAVAIPEFEVDDTPLSARLQAQRRSRLRAGNADKSLADTVLDQMSAHPVRGWALVAVAVVLLAGLGFGLSQIVTRVKTRHGILALEVNEPDVDVFVDGEKVTVSWKSSEPGKQQATVEVSAGEHEIRLKKAGFSVAGEPEKLTFKEGKREIFTARLTPATATGQDKGKPAKGAGTPEQSVAPADAPGVATGPSVPADAVRFGGKWFKVYPERLKWDAASQRCQELGGRLAEARSREENEFLFNLAKPFPIDGVWLGATDRIQEGKWIWGDGTALGYTNWDVGQPNNFGSGGEDCLLLLLSLAPGKWWDQPTESGLGLPPKWRTGFICQWDDRPAAGQVNVRSALFRAGDLAGWSRLPGFWKVQDGSLVGNRAPGQPRHTFLCSQQTYRDFELRFKVRRKNGVGQSGLQFRSQVTSAQEFRVAGPQIQIGTLDQALPPGSLVREPNGGPVFSTIRPLVSRIWKEADFNEMFIRCVGKHVQVRLSSVTVLDIDDPTLPDEGILAWQWHGTLPPEEIVFKDVEFADLTRGDPPLPAPRLSQNDESQIPEPAPGFVWLFDGTAESQLKNWCTHPSQPGNWRVEGTDLVGSGPGAVSHLYTVRDDFQDFHLRFDVLVNTDGNSGVYLRSGFGPVAAGPQGVVFAPQGYNAKLDNRRWGGLLSDEFPLQRTKAKARNLGEWVEVDLIALGKDLTVKIDGIITAEYHDDRGLFAKGRIALQQHGSYTTARFRKIQIREIPSPAGQ